MEDYRLEQTGAEVQEILNTATPQADLTAETERAQEAESALGGRIDDEELRAKAAEEANAGAIHDEELRAKAAEEINANAIASINEKIPSAASSENKLADVDFVNSSIATATATFRGSFNLVSDLHLAIDATHAQIETLLGTVISVADKNDYCYVQIPTSAETPTQIASVELYKFTDEGWRFGYVLNNSGFTAAQWAALNSAITSGLVAKLNALPTNEELAALLGAKQDVLTFDNVPVEGSNNPVKSGGVHSAIDDEKTARVNNVNTLQGEIDAIEGKIPTGASSDNKLVDTATMNSSISTATATYRGDFNLVSDLHLDVDATHAQIATMLASEIATADNNDYCYVQIPTSAETPTQIAKVERYKYNGSAWGYEYDLNNSGFTASQWAALNSAITSGLVAKLSALPTNQELTAALAAKQDVLTFDQTPTENSTNPVTSGGVYAADKALSDAIEAILLLIPSAATQLNKLVDVAQMNSSISTATATYRGSYNLVSDLSLTIDATEQQIATALAATISTADNNDYAFVQVPTSSETPTQIARTDRYKFNGTVWAFEYTLNTSGFTSAQWAAINSGITTVLVAKLSALPTNSELTSQLGLLNDGISAINLKIPATASQSNKLIDAAGLNETLALALGAIDATFNVTSTDGHITLHITQVDGEITSVQVQSTDIASAAALNLKASQADLTALTTRVTTAEGNITSLTGRMSTAEGDITTLQNLYNSLQQSAPQVIQPTDTWPVTNPSTTVIYRVIDRVNTPPQYYSDYMWNGTAMILMATYNNAIDDVPTAGSDNLVKSGGVNNSINDIIYDISKEYPTSGINSGNTYTLYLALLTIPTGSRKYNMFIKFIDSTTNKYVYYKYYGSDLGIEFTACGNWKIYDYIYNKVDEYLDFDNDNLLNNSTLYRNKLKQSASNISDSNTYSYFEVWIEKGQYTIYPRTRIVLGPSGNTLINRDNKEPETFTADYSGVYTINVYTTDISFCKLYKSSSLLNKITDYGWKTFKENVSQSSNKNEKIDSVRLFGTSLNLLSNSILTKGHYKSGSTIAEASNYSYFSLILPPGTYKVGPNSRFIVADNGNISDIERKAWYSFTIDKYRMVDITVFTRDINITKLCLSTEFEYDIDPYGNDIFSSNVNPRNNNLAGKKIVFCGDSFTEYTAITGGSPEKTNANYDFDADVYKTYPWWIWKRNGFALVNEAKSGTSMTHINGRTDAFSDSRYQSLGIGVDYIILKFGINDNNNHVTIGTISDNVNTTFYGAWNVVLSYLREHYPLAKIGIIISNGISDIDYVNAEINIAKKWGCSYLNEALGEDIPVFMRTSRTDVDASYRQTLIETFSVNYPSDTHPNIDWHQYESTIVENWMRSL